MLHDTGPKLHSSIHHVLFNNCPQEFSKDISISNVTFKVVTKYAESVTHELKKLYLDDFTHNITRM